MLFGDLVLEKVGLSDVASQSELKQFFPGLP